MAIQLDVGVLACLRSGDFKAEVESLERYLQVLTRPPMFTTLRIDRSCITAEEAEEKICQSLEEQSLKSGVATFPMFWHKDFDDCLVLQNRGPNSVDTVEKEVMVDLACGMAVLRGANIFIQGIMAAPTSLAKGDAVSVFADLDKKCLKGLTTKYTGRKLFVGNGISQVSRADVFNAHSESLRGLAVLMTQPVYEAPCLSELAFPWLVAQNLPSIACVHALDPRPGQAVLDMCAAPGGKTSHIAALMEHRGSVVALEKSGQRAKKLEKMGLPGVQVFTFDATKALSPGAEAVSGEQHAGPAADLLKPHGVLVYSTCTITAAENEEQVAKLLAKRPDLQLVAPSVQLGKGGLRGSQLTAEQSSMVQRFDPGELLSCPGPASGDLHNVDTIGFFIAKFVKAGQKEGT
ncbi:hypothetical protein EGW08_004660 [Elysia chlorotica]|uniref:SAM-dependent MTase RsmB/NOP-type domain-containing protein n=1 Tax=Elysia chlorotica TaxID=188477 RepID=A0A433U126_ELYCH|nr:hypothetical protein EGW08_004660 [Elysia chlorotica]